MAFCPKCQQEYDPAIVLCQKCGGELGDLPGAEGVANTEIVRLISLTAVSDVVEASMLQGALESQGIHPRLVHHILPAHGDILRDWSTRDWGDLRVPEDELEEARLVLEDFREAVRRSGPLGSEDLVDPPGGAAGNTGDPPDMNLPAKPHEPRLRAVDTRQGAEASAGQPGGTRMRPVELSTLCAVSNLAEGKMLEGALRNQGLHPVFAPAPPGTLGRVTGPRDEIRVPPEEILEARVILEDFRRALERQRGESPASDDASED